MNERLKDIPSPVPNESSQSGAQPQTHPSDYTAPLHERLPLEIFGDIIHLCVGFSTPVRDLVTLQLVCRSWHDIIAGASFLWGTLSAAEGLPAMQKALRMAKDASLDLKFNEETSATSETDFFTLANERINQWRSFVVESAYCPSALGNLRAQRPLRLETLQVIGKYYELPRNGEIVLFGGDSAPGLKDVWLAYVPISRASLQLSGLKSLRLRGIPSVSAPELITLITGSPGLEILHLVSLEGAVLPTQATPSQPNLASNPVIELAFLIDLKLFSLHISFLSYLFSTVAFPQLRFLRLGGDFGENPALQLGETVGLNRLNPSINSIASGAEMYKVTISSWGYYVISIGRLDIKISFPGELPTDHLLETFTWLSGHLEQSLNDLPLHLNLKNLDSEPSYLEWFTSHTNVIMLTLYSHPWPEPDQGSIFQTLSRPTSSPPSPPTWLLPQVEVLDTNFVYMDGDFALVGMIEARHAASRGSFAAGANRAFPKRFREIRLAYGWKAYTGPRPNADLMSRVVQAAEGADVYWEGKKWVGS